MKKDISIKIVSVLFAVLLWLFVLNNIDNPFQSTSIAVPIRVLNENTLDEKGLGIRNKNYLKSVEVEVKGRKEQIAAVTGSDLEATVDFSSIKDSGKRELRVEVVSRKEGIQIGEVRPKTINVEVDKVIKKSFKVELVPVGKVKENYKIIRMAAAPEMVTLEGLESVINSIANVKATIDVNNLAKSMVIRKECKAYNKNEEEVAGATKNLEVEVSVEVAKEVPVVALVKGKPAKDFVEISHKASVEKVWVTGLPEVLDSVMELNTEPVNIDNINKSSDIKTTLRVPEGVKLVDASKELVVSVLVEALVQKDFAVKKEDLITLNMDENTFKYEILTASFNAGIKGKQKELNVLDPYSLRPTIDLTGLGEGTQKVPVKITLLNPELKLVDSYFVEVKISKK